MFGGHNRPDEHVQYTLPLGRAWIKQKEFPCGSVYKTCLSSSLQLAQKDLFNLHELM